MSQYLKKFDTHSQYLAYIDSSDFIDPNVSICNFEGDIHYTKKRAKGVRIRFMNREINPEANRSGHSVCLAPIIQSSYSNMPYITASQYKFTIDSSGRVQTANSKSIGGQGGSDYALWYSDVNSDILWEKIEEYPQFVKKYQRQSVWYYVYTTFWTKPAGNSYSSYIYNYDQYSIIGDLADLFGARDLASIPGNYLGMYGNLFDASANNNKDLSKPVYLYEFPNMSSFTSCKEESFCYFFRGQRYASNSVELNITELKTRCFAGMFYGCSNFSDLTVHFTEWDPEGTSNCTNGWLDGVSATGVFRCPKALPIERGPARIPEGWDVEYID